MPEPSLRIRDNELPEFKALRLAIESWACGQLEASAPSYVEAFNKALNSAPPIDIERVMRETVALLPDRTPWHGLLTATLDVELWTDRVRQAVHYVGYSPDGNVREAHPGIWLLYHVDSWCLFAYGFLERVKRLVRGVCREILRPESASWSVIQRSLVSDILKLRGKLEGVRNSVAHTGGSVEGVAKERIWDPYLLVERWGGDSGSIEMVGNYYDSVVKFKDKWSQGINSSTIHLFAASEAIFRKLREEAFATSSNPR